MQSSPCASFGKRLLVLLTIGASLTLLFGCRQGLDSEKRDPVARNSVEAAYLWPGTRIDFVDEEGALVTKLRERKRGFKVFDSDRRPVALVAAEESRIVVNDLMGNDHRIVVREEKATLEQVPLGSVRTSPKTSPSPKNIVEEVSPTTPYDNAPKVIFSVYATKETLRDPLESDLPSEGGNKGANDLQLDRNKKIASVALFEKNDERTWRILDGGGKQMVDIEQSLAKTDVPLLVSRGDKSTPIELREVESETASRGIEARTKGAKEDEASAISSPRCGFPPLVLAPLLLQSDDLLMKAGLIQLFRCEGLEACSETAAPASGQDKKSSEE